ncbi:MAG: GNAT family N-acetyltransferase [Alphaproteobacteria bacterium]|nr:GNAT family N-acetyltransferase [Alphaproteobacteria bacterium]
MPLSFRDATGADIASVLELCRAGALNPDRYPPLDLADPAYAALFDAISADPNHRLIVCEKDGEIVGTLMISFLPDLVGRSWRGQLENVHVHSGRRGSGIGSEMVAWAVARCRERGCDLVQLTSNKARHDAHRFYERLGFEKSHEGMKLKL